MRPSATPGSAGTSSNRPSSRLELPDPGIRFLEEFLSLGLRADRPALTVVTRGTSYFALDTLNVSALMRLSCASGKSVLESQGVDGA
jgi:hypothetical protein